MKRSTTSSWRKAKSLCAMLGLLLPVLAQACAAGRAHTPTTDEPVTVAGDAGTGTAAVDGAVSDAGPAPCASLCGSSNACCTAQQECSGGACVPACASGVHCGASCCAAGQVCGGDVACATPTTACQDSVDCAPMEICDPSIGMCIPDPGTTNTCQLTRPPVGFNPVLKWSFTTPVAQPGYSQTWSAPLVADVNGDGQPEVVVTTGADDMGSAGEVGTPGFVRLLDGQTGAELWDDTVPALQMANLVDVSWSPAIANLGDGNGVTIVAISNQHGLIAFNAQGAVVWESTDTTGAPYHFPEMDSSTIAIADMNNDGLGEIVVGGAIFDHTGRLVAGGDQVQMGGDASYGFAAITILADVEGMGQLDVVGGKGAYRYDGSAVWAVTDPTVLDGFPAIADFEGDGKPELVVASEDGIHVRDATTGAEPVTPIPLPPPYSNTPGAPTIATFGGNGVIEIVVESNDVVSCFDYSLAAGLSLKWSYPLLETSGFLTVTAFDFDGDGHVEVIAHDDCFVNVLDGDDGTLILRFPASHQTTTEFVDVADVDGDHSADLLFSSNERWNGGEGDWSLCQYSGTDGPRHGVFVYSDPNEAWMPTRRIWNEHAYHVTNIKVDATLPSPEANSWGPSGFNDYRVSVQGNETSLAPDLIVNLSASIASCPTSLVLDAAVANQGSIGVPAGVIVEFFSGGLSGTVIGQATTTVPLAPGQSQVLTLTVPATATATSYAAAVNQVPPVTPECDTSNDTSTLSGVQCETPQ